MNEIEVAYVRVEVPDPDALGAFLTDVIGPGDGWVPEIRCQVAKEGDGDDPILIYAKGEILANGRTM